MGDEAARMLAMLRPQREGDVRCVADICSLGDFAVGIATARGGLIGRSDRKRMGAKGCSVSSDCGTVWYSMGGENACGADGGSARRACHGCKRRERERHRLRQFHSCVSWEYVPMCQASWQAL